MRFKLVKLHVADKGGSVVAAINCTSLQRRWGFGPRKWHRVRAKGLKSCDHHLVFGDTNFETFHVRHGVYGAHRVVEIAVERWAERQHVNRGIRLKLVFHELADFAIQNTIKVFLVLEDVWKNSHVHQRPMGRHVVCRDKKAVHGAKLHRFEGFIFAGNLIAAAQFHIDCAICVFFGLGFEDLSKTTVKRLFGGAETNVHRDVCSHGRGCCRAGDDGSCQYMFQVCEFHICLPG